MIELANLESIQKKTANQNVERHAKSDELYEQGRGLVQAALHRTVDRAQLQEAAACFTQGVQANYKNPKNYIGMGFLFLVLKQPWDALRYIKEALALEPGNQLALDLSAQAERQTKPEVASKPSLPQRPKPGLEAKPEVVDYDKLYDQTEMEIVAFIKNVMQEDMRKLTPSPNTTHFQSIQAKYKTIQKTYQKLRKQIDVVDEEIDTGALRKNLNPVETVLKRFENLLETCQHFIDISNEIKEQQELTTQVIGESKQTTDPEDIPILEENLEALLDNCDSLAERLAQIEKQGHVIQPLEKPYNSFVDVLEQFQDVLDETVDRLQKVMKG